jgi:serine protease Do
MTESNKLACFSRASSMPGSGGAIGQPTGRPRCRHRFHGLAVLIIVATQITLAQTEAPPANTARPFPSSPDLKSALLHQLDDSLQQVAARVSPAVVQIVVSGYRPVEDHEGNATAKLARASVIGSGIIVDPDGYVMTNAHVVEGAQRIRVILSPSPVNSPFELQPVKAQQILEATLHGTNKQSDLALLKVNATHLPSLSLHPDIPVHQGELVFALGSPEGLQDSITMGVVSSVTRQLDTDNPMVYIQTDAPINHGNSGGPLVDIDGHVIGMNTLNLSDSGGSEGLGFAIPAAIIDFDYRNLRKYGRVQHVIIGARTQNITPTLAAGLNLPRSWGAIISNVQPLGNAETAGLQVGDIVVAIDGRPVRGAFDYNSALYLHPVDRIMKIEVLRGARKLSFDVPVLQHHEQVQDLADIPDLQKSYVPKLSVFVTDLTQEVQKVLRPEQTFSGIAVVAEAASPFALYTGLKKGDIIRSINGAMLEQVDQLRTAIPSIKSGDPVVLQIERGGKLQYLAFESE